MFCHGKMVMEKLHFLECELLIWSQLWEEGSAVM
jgi:hypothetical protein